MAAHGETLGDDDCTHAPEQTIGTTQDHESKDGGNPCGDRAFVPGNGFYS